MREFSFDLGPLLLSLRVERSKRYGNEFEPAGPAWHDALQASGGYASAEIFEKGLNAARQVRDGLAVFERDTVTFQHQEYSHQLLAWMTLARFRMGKLHVLDFGGGFGSRYFQHRSLLHELGNVRWAVVEQENIVNAGRTEFTTTELGFFESVLKAEQDISPNFLLVSSSLQYMEHPYEMLEELLSRRYPYFLLDRTMARKWLPDELYIQHVPPSIYQASYPVWFLNAQRIEELVQSHGYRLVEQVDPFPGSVFGSPKKGWPYMSWYFERVK